jgi:hypothetical protein
VKTSFLDWLMFCGVISLLSHGVMGALLYCTGDGWLVYWALLAYDAPVSLWWYSLDAHLIWLPIAGAAQWFLIGLLGGGFYRLASGRWPRLV